MSARLTRRVDRVADRGTRRRHPPEPPGVGLGVLTAAECEAAAGVRQRLDALGLSGIPDADLDFCLCLNERLSGRRDASCVLGAG